MTDRTKRLRIGVLGCGPIAQIAHFDACRKARNAELYAICDTAEDLLTKMAALHGPRKTYRQFDELLADPAVDAVIIGTSDPFHVPLSRQAIAAGKHVLVEKPLGVTIEECEQLRSAVRASGLVLQVGHNRRFDPGIAFAQRFIRDELGQHMGLKYWYYDSTYRYTMTDNLQPLVVQSGQARRPPGNPKENKRRYFLLTHGSHLVDSARFLGGEIARIRARLLERFGAFCWFVDLDFADGSLGHLDMTIAIRGDFEEGFQIYGEHGSVTGKVHLPWFHKSSIVMLLDQGPPVPSPLGRGRLHLQIADRKFRQRDPRRHAAGRGRRRRRPGQPAGDGGDRPLGRDRPAGRAGGDDGCRHMRLGIFAKTFARPTLPEVLAAVAGVGLDCVQFNLGCVGLDTLPADLPAPVADEIGRQFAAAGISMVAVSGTFNLIHPDLALRQSLLANLAVLAGACRWLGTEVITLCSGTCDPTDMWRAHPNNNSPQAWRDMVASLRLALDLTATSNVTLAIEPEPANVVDSAEKGVALLAEIGSPRLKIVIDGANLIHGAPPAQAGELLRRSIQLLAPHTAIAHAKDLAGLDAGRRPTLDYPAYLAQLAEAGFDGPLIVHGVDEQQAPQALAFVNAALGQCDIARALHG